MVVIPFLQLEPDVLRAVLEEFASRDGTDYGVEEVSLDVKVAHIMSQLRAQELVLCFDQASESCDLLKPQDAKALQAAMAVEAEYY